VVIRSSGYILTDDHVISVAANGGTVSVMFSDGHTAGATIVGRDPFTDLGVIKANAGEPDLPTIAIGASRPVRVGQPVVALGSPLGLTSTVTSGIVSALDRYVRVPAGGGVTAHLVGAIQTDASINPGNSGGASWIARPGSSASTRRVHRSRTQAVGASAWGSPSRWISPSRWRMSSSPTVRSTTPASGCKSKRSRARLRNRLGSPRDSSSRR
jgi:Trypsin-like peptidase domain